MVSRRGMWSNEKPPNGGKSLNEEDERRKTVEAEQRVYVCFLDHPGLYQPRITRLPSLLCLFTITVALIAVIELACRRLPSRYPAASAVLLPRDGPNAALVARHPLAWPQECENACRCNGVQRAFL